MFDLVTLGQYKMKIRIELKENILREYENIFSFFIITVNEK